MNGHWFCVGVCNDVVILPHTRAAVGPGLVKCPQCHKPTAKWIPDRQPHKSHSSPRSHPADFAEMPATNRPPAISPKRATELFGQMFQAAGINP